MDRFNIPVPPDEDFPEVVVAQRMGEGFEREYVEYEPRWRFDRRRRAVVADEKFFYAMADTAERLKAENAKLREERDNYKALWEHATVTDCELRRVRAAWKEDREQNAKLRELAVLNWEWAHSCCGNNCKMQTNDCGYQIDRECNYEREIWDRMRELGIEVTA